MFVVDDHESRQRPDPEATSECRLLVDVDTMETEGVVVCASLEHLGEITLDPPRWTRARAL